ncbi:MAG TPA: methyl-accepting chemotaxis protein [Pseudorhodoplanes sp.]|nr:methyl-accepting chemotaxis protein [Pseudorhodoplanes sp.]
MKRIFGSLSLANRAIILIGLVVALTTACAVSAAYWALSNEFNAKARDDIETNLRTLALVYAEKYPETKLKLEDNKVVRAEAPSFPGIFPDHNIVDTTAAHAGGNATLFMWDQANKQFIRRTTNVKKENGDRAIGTALAPDHPGQELLRAGQAYKGPATLFGRKFYTAYFPIVDPQNKTLGLLYVGNSIEIYDAMLAHAIWSMLTAAAIGILIVLALSLWLVRRNVKPLKDVTGVVDGMAKGQLDTDIPHTARGDEIGLIARSLAVFRDAAARNREMENEERSKSESERRRVQAVEDITRQFEANVATLMADVGKTISALEGDAATMRTHAETTRERAQSAAQSAGHASENVQSVAAATEEMAGSVSEIGRQVSSSSEIATRAVKEAEDTNRQVKELSAAAMKIGEIVSLIQTIAAQTNLLALNATIESARAGEAGRGFAVVASEVKSLATQTGKATEDIGRQIEEMQKATNEAVAAIGGISETIGAMDRIAVTIANAVEEQGAATQEIARGVGSARGEAETARISISDVEDVAGETTRSSDAVSKAASDMASRLRGLDDEIRSFLSRMQAA